MFTLFKRLTILNSNRGLNIIKCIFCSWGILPNLSVPLLAVNLTAKQVNVNQKHGFQAPQTPFPSQICKYTILKFRIYISTFCDLFIVRIPPKCNVLRNGWGDYVGVLCVVFVFSASADAYAKSSVSVSLNNQ